MITNVLASRRLSCPISRIRKWCIWCIIGQIVNSIDDNHCHRTLKAVPRNLGGSGRFELHAQSSTFGRFPYTVYGYRLIVGVGTKKTKFFDIEDPDVWKWLIIRNPLDKLHAYKKSGEPASAFREYTYIVKSLKLVERAQHTLSAKGKTLKTVQKYKLLRFVVGEHCISTK